MWVEITSKKGGRSMINLDHMVSIAPEQGGTTFLSSNKDRYYALEKFDDITKAVLANQNK